MKALVTFLSKTQINRKVDCMYGNSGHLRQQITAFLGKIDLKSFAQESPEFSDFLRTRDEPDQIGFHVVHEAEDFSIMVMRFSKELGYLYHDHRDMMVCSKILKGVMRATCLDYKDPKAFYWHVDRDTQEGVSVEKFNEAIQRYYKGIEKGEVSIEYPLVKVRFLYKQYFKDICFQQSIYFVFIL